MKRIKYSLFALLAVATVAMAADKYISSSGNLVLKTGTGKYVGLQDGLYVTQSKNVGVGTSSPAGLFDVNSKFTVLSSGNVGVGTTSPGKALDVTGEIRASSNVIGKNVISYETGGISNPLSYTTNIAINSADPSQPGTIGCLILYTGGNSGGNAFSKLHLVAVKPNGGGGNNIYSAEISTIGVGPNFTYDNNGGFLRITSDNYMNAHIVIFR